MEEVRKCASARGFVGDVLKTGGRDVGEKDLSAAGGFPADLLGKVADCKIDGIGRLVTEDGELSLVRGDDDRDDGRSGPLLLECFLNCEVFVRAGLKH